MKRLRLILLFIILSSISACSQTAQTVPAVKADPVRLDMTNFLGEKIVLAGTYPANITQLNLKLNFPQGHELLIHANPKIEFYSGAGELILKKEIYPNTRNYPINKVVGSPVFYIKLGIYYCKTGDAGLCMIQNVLYTVNSSAQLPAGPINIEYNVPGSNF